MIVALVIQFLSRQILEGVILRVSCGRDLELRSSELIRIYLLPSVHNNGRVFRIIRAPVLALLLRVICLVFSRKCVPILNADSISGFIVLVANSFFFEIALITFGFRSCRSPEFKGDVGIGAIDPCLFNIYIDSFFVFDSECSGGAFIANLLAGRNLACILICLGVVSTLHYGGVNSGAFLFYFFFRIGVCCCLCIIHFIDSLVAIYGGFYD